ncbi:MAG: YchF/TatD family DNA exonuclease [Magnetococcales bacterium]|nr:YchF/TatD family DNA exonuclease [Magnetococcales bacterium]
MDHDQQKNPSNAIFADSHAHLDFPDFQEDLEAVVLRAAREGVRYINTISTRLDQAPLLKDMCAAHTDLYYSVGIHPHEADKAPDISVEATMDVARGCSDKLVAIGEAGLDYHYDFSVRDRQRETFRNQVRAAVALDLPLIIHTREAEEDTRTILEEEMVSTCGGVLHCFTGSSDLALWGLDQGLYISFSGILTFRNAEDLRQTAALVPLDRLLIETDSPYLAPIPYRGKRNEPSYVTQVAKVLAELHGKSLEEIAQITTENYRRLFRIGRSRQGQADGGEVLAYPIGSGLYLNITQGCTLRCRFCPKWSAPIVHKYDLSLKGNPTAQELIEAMGDISGYDEVVFCGYGEPTLRLETLLAVAAEVKRRGKPVRVNTDGLANLVHRQDVTPRLKGLVDELSVSLNAQDEATYQRHCAPGLEGSYQAVQAFIQAAIPHVPTVTASAIEGLDGVDIPACKALAESLGARFRTRHLHRVG